MSQKFICFPSTKFYIYILDADDIKSLNKFRRTNKNNIYGTLTPVNNIAEGDIVFIYEKGKNSGFYGMFKIKNTIINEPHKYNIFNDKNKNVQYVCTSHTETFDRNIKLLNISDELKKCDDFKSSSSFSNKFIKKSSEIIRINSKLGKVLLSSIQNYINNNTVITPKKNNSDNEDNSDTDNNSDTKNDSDTYDNNNSDDDSIDDISLSSCDLYDSDTSTSDSNISDEPNNNIPILLDPCRKFIKTSNSKIFCDNLCSHVMKCKNCKITDNNKIGNFNKHIFKECQIIIHEDNYKLSELFNSYHNMEPYLITAKSDKKKDYIMDVVYITNNKTYRKCYFLCIHHSQ